MDRHVVMSSSPISGQEEVGLTLGVGYAVSLLIGWIGGAHIVSPAAVKA